MVTLQEKVRNKLQSKIFDKIGKSVALKTLSTATAYDERGDLTGAAYTTSTITAVPYDITKDDHLNQVWGPFTGGSLFMAVPYSVNILLNDILTVDDYDYRVDKIKEADLPDNVVTILMLNKVQ